MKSKTVFLRITILLMGLAMLAFCIFVIPHFLLGFYKTMSGVLVQSLLLGVGCAVAAVLFFLVLGEAWKLLNYIDHDSAFSQIAVDALRRIKYFAYSICGIFILELPVFYIFAEKDDAPGLIIIGIIFAGAPLVIAIFANLLQILLQRAIEIKSENDLTI
ncbi:DUF2975 domain-containing protein [Companilactobacillus mishanensis]|uniref:DUF2975 domain-containing protein n=1 Tax=Companilactobacillus mishanensis TaxID=2486008 RepID=A0A5P0ZH54_9LACO|nr:DUF2975 domain-containing protein [Companilactobacillus mishanensis]MQS44989.1 DUF2975 domain-containing protein [Companilactobacillus mishanensis]MQS52332.1 DUF2975 domain-containing protein [Companilactobacillus mishanensis]MQS89505.1 DUF2975 domain-containing protein [Companilactobacillus mishanensis]